MGRTIFSQNLPFRLIVLLWLAVFLECLFNIGRLTHQLPRYHGLDLRTVQGSVYRHSQITLRLLVEKNGVCNPKIGVRRYPAAYIYRIFKRNNLLLICKTPSCCFGDFTGYLLILIRFKA